MKNIYKLFGAVLFTAGTLAADAQIPTNGLQVHYLFDGNLNDNSGNGYNATFDGTLSYVHSGYQNPVDSSFKGIGLYELYHNYSAHPTEFQTQDFTCLIWIKLDSFPNTYVNLMENGDSYSSVYFRLLKTSNFGRIQVGAYNNATSSGFNSEIEPDVDPSEYNNWHMIGVSSGFDIPTNKRVTQIYFDGASILTDSISTNTTIAYNGSSVLSVASRYDWDTYNFMVLGGVNNFAYYNRILSSAEVSQYYNIPTLSIDENTPENSISIFPNPANNLVNITDIEVGSHLKLVDISGKIIYSRTAQNNIEQINLEGIISGIYFLQIEQKGNITTKKLIINK